uniref:SEC23 interacting protein n=1 Tax=Salmo trutta TaxID=8032 RepID=A0A673Y3K5_SALTR
SASYSSVRSTELSYQQNPCLSVVNDTADVGEEDSFLGQAFGNAPAAPSTFSYFSSSVNSSDPFASIGHQPACPPPASLSVSSATSGPTSVPSVASMAPTPPVPLINSNPAVPQPFVTAPDQSYNPYRHTPLSSRAKPYMPASEVQSLFHPPPQQNPYTVGSPAPTFQSAPSTFTKPFPTQIQGPPPMAQHSATAVQPHWFFCKQVESKSAWLPFSILDSIQLEEIYNSVQPDPENVIVCTDGGRYDVQLYDRIRTAVFWEEEPTEVRRCTWFYKGDTDSRFIPYSEEFSEKLEGEYKKAVSTNQWHRRLEFSSGETIVMHNPKVIVQFQPSDMPDEWGTTQDGQTRPRVVKRGIDDDHDEVPDGELPQVDHLVFMVHGIGPVCDLRFRSMVECVDDFRSVSLKLLQSHFKKAQEERVISRVEFLPVQWHTALHGDATGVDKRIKKITLPSTGRLRHFTNETLLDVLFYNSPTYCQTIMDTVALEINRIYALFLQRNPDFTGGISVSGHSLGTNTKAAVEEEPKEEGKEFVNLSSALEHLGLSEYQSTLEQEKIDLESFLMCTVEDLKEMSIPLGPRKKIAKFVKERAIKQAAQEKKAAEVKVASQDVVSAQSTEPLPGPGTTKLPVGGTYSSVHVDYNYFDVGTGQVSVVYHTLDFEPVNFFALGSPIGMFLTVRGLKKIEENYQLPTCKGFFNIYHPLDPVAYRIEPMILPDLDLKPVLIPHHKGRKRLHLELKESLSRMGSDLKHGFISSLRSAWQTLNDFARAHTSNAQLAAELAMVANQIEEEEEKHAHIAEHRIVESPELLREEETQMKIGMLNGGNRIDYVLQEKPIESFNEYLFALQSHLCYWESEDTALLLLKEIYMTMEIYPEQILH